MISFQELAISMLKCEQTKGQSVYQHGVSVRAYFEDLIDGQTLEWKIPSWFENYKNKIIDNLHNHDRIVAYTQFHDCGKSFCKIVDADGKIHYPNHAHVSKELFLEAGGDPIAAKLIGYDMELHMASSDQIKEYLEKEWTIQDSMTLLLAALAEIHSNAKMFSSESNSFKIKWKNLDRRGKQICKFYFGDI